MSSHRPGEGLRSCSRTSLALTDARLGTAGLGPAEAVDARRRRGGHSVGPGPRVGVAADAYPGPRGPSSGPPSGPRRWSGRTGRRRARLCARPGQRRPHHELPWRLTVAVLVTLRASDHENASCSWRCGGCTSSSTMQWPPPRDVGPRPRLHDAPQGRAALSGRRARICATGCWSSTSSAKPRGSQPSACDQGEERRRASGERRRAQAPDSLFG